jgi:hypothetical protein
MLPKMSFTEAKSISAEEQSSLMTERRRILINLTSLTVLSAEALMVATVRRA